MATTQAYLKFLYDYLLSLPDLFIPTLFVLFLCASLFVAYYVVKWLMTIYPRYKFYMYAAGVILAALSLCLICLYPGVAAYIATVLVSCVLVFFLPGYMLYNAMVKEKLNFELLEVIFLQLLGSILVSGLVGLLLAEVGAFSLLNLLLVLAVFCGALQLAFKVGFHLDRFPKPELNKKMLPLLLIILISITLFFHPNEWILGGRDQGVYVNAGINIAKTGAIVVHDDLMASMNSTVRQAFYLNFQFPGFYRTDPDTGLVTPQAYFLWPAWIAIFYSIFGLGLFLYVTPFFALLSVLSIYLAGKFIFSRNVGLLASFFMAINLALIWYAREPTTEVLTLLLIFSGIFTFILLNRKSVAPGKYFGVISALCLGEIFLMRIDTVLLVVPVALYLGYLLLRGEFSARHVYFTAVFALVGLDALLVAVTIAHGYTFSFMKKGAVGTLINSGVVYLIPILLIVLVVLAVVLYKFRKYSTPATDKISVYLGYARPLLIVLIFAGIVFAYFIRPMGAADAFSNDNNLVRLSWYTAGFYGVLLAGIGCALLLYKKPYRESYFLASLFLIYAVFYLWNANIHGDNPWWVRRYLPIVLPMAIICIAYFYTTLDGLIKNHQYRKIVMPVLLVLFILPSLVSGGIIMNHVQYGGAIDGIDGLSQKLDDDSIILYTRNYFSDKIALPLYYIYDEHPLIFNLSEDDYEDMYDQLCHWVGENKTIYLMDALIHNEAEDDDTYIEYPIDWYYFLTPPEENWGRVGYFYIPDIWATQSHIYEIYAIRDRDSLDRVFYDGLVPVRKKYSDTDYTWYDPEVMNGTIMRYMSNDASLAVISDGGGNSTLSFDASSFNRPRTLQIYLNGALVGQAVVDVNASRVTIPLTLDDGYNLITFHSVEAPEQPIGIPELRSIDRRYLSVLYTNFSLA